MNKRIFNILAYCLALMLFLSGCEIADSGYRIGRDTEVFWKKGKIQIGRTYIRNEIDGQYYEVYGLSIDDKSILYPIQKYSYDRRRLYMIHDDEFAMFDLSEERLSLWEDIDGIDDIDIREAFLELLSR